MSKKFNKTVALICAVCLAVTVMATGVSAAGSRSGTEAKLTDTQIYVDGLLACRGYLRNGITYASFDSLYKAIGQAANVKWTETPNGTGTVKTMTAAVGGIEITYTVGKQYLCANGRYIYLPDGCIEKDGAVLLPLRALAKIFTLSLTKDDNKDIVRIGTEKMAVLEAGSTFYNAEDQDILAHIIYAEAGNQPLEGKIGVGNVVLNRVASSRFPNTVREVVYAPGQFEPVYRGTIRMEPNEESVLASYLALEGYNTVGDSVYFHNPGSSTGYLMSSTFVVRIEDHVFFLEP